MSEPWVPSDVPSVGHILHPPRSRHVRVLIADDEPAFARLLAKVLSRDPNMHVVASVRTSDEAVAAAQRVHPDVALLDVRMPHGGGARAAAEIKAHMPRTCVVAVSAFSDRASVLEMLSAGADGYIVKGTSANEILTGIQGAVRGEAPLSGTLSRGVLGELQRHLRHQDQVRGNQLEVRDRIQRALSGDGFAMAFQPITDLGSGMIIGVEALARFAGPPVQGPAAWFRDASAVGMRAQLEVEAARRALASLPRLPERAFVAINVNPELAGSSELADVIPDSLAPHVVLELVDHGDVADYDSLAVPLRALRARGVRLAIDDSGEGLASLQRIAPLAPDFLKLSRSLTRSIDSDPTRRALASALVSFGTETGAAVVAEGIETPEELSALRDLGVRFGQGFLIGRPAMLEDDGAPLAVAVDLPGMPRVPRAVRRYNTFREGVTISLEALAEALPDSSVVISHIDYDTHSVRALGAAGPEELGLEVGRTFALEASSCYLMASGRGPRICGDVPSENAYARVPLLVAAEALSFAGAPIELPSGRRVGAVSVFTSRPEGYGAQDLDLVRSLAASLARALSQHEPVDPGLLDERLRHYAGVDWLTGAMNRHWFAEALDDQWRRAKQRSKWVLAAHVPDLATVNERYGRTIGDLVLKDLASALTDDTTDGRVVGRVGGSRFVAVLPACDREPAAQRVRKEFAERMAARLARRGIRATVTAGLAPLLASEEPDQALTAAAACAELVA